MRDKQKLRMWINYVCTTENFSPTDVSVVFCSDDYLFRLNLEYLNHDTLTDILTFDYSEEGKRELAGEIYISLERIRENARKFDVRVRDELHRVIIHGFLHMMSYDDHSDRDRLNMRAAEDKYLSLRPEFGIE
ncbi:MAG: rRNA maturation RNase YbeY [Bacteroidales bacterium]